MLVLEKLLIAVVAPTNWLSFLHHSWYLQDTPDSRWDGTFSFVTVICILYCVLCNLYSVFCNLYFVNGTFPFITVFRIMYSVFCNL